MFLSLSSLAHADTVVLLDQFDDGNLATNTGLGAVGYGFTTDWIDCGTGSGVTGSEADDLAVIDGASCVHFMQSNDPIDPTRTTMIWTIEKLPADPAQGVLVGWVQDGKDACCETGIYLGIEGHRVVLDFQAKSGADPFQWQGRYFDIPAGSTATNEVFPGGVAGPVTAILSVDEYGWRVSIHGSGIDIFKAGSYSSCPNPDPVSGQCISLNDVLTYPGVNGVLHAVAGAYREHQSAEFQSVVVTRQIGVP
jgi:hypothetical protein